MQRHRLGDNVFGDGHASAGSALPLADWEYFGPGRVAEVTLANGLACTYMNNDRTHSAVQAGVSNPAWGSATTDRLGYDGAGRMIGKRYLPQALNQADGYADTTPTVGFTTDFDKASNKLYERHLHAENRSHLYNSLDSMNRLREYQRGELASGGASVATPITLPGTDSMYSWTLDSVGDWRKTTRTPVGGSETTEVRQHNKLHQITRFGETDFAYDASGNMLDDGTLTFAYDALNRVKTVTKKTGSLLLATYTYDAMGRRVRKIITNGGLSGTITNGTTDYLYDGNQCVEERDGSNNPKRQFVWGLYIDELLQLRVISGQNSVDYYPLQDLLYRTTALTNGSGAIVETYDIDAYGRTLMFNAAGTDSTWFTDDDVTTKRPTCEIIFAGYRYDPESELYYVRNRTYNPVLGRWLQRDPAGYVDGMSLYEYVGGQPAGKNDPAALGELTDIIVSKHFKFCYQVPQYDKCIKDAEDRAKAGYASNERHYKDLSKAISEQYDRMVADCDNAHPLLRPLCVLGAQYWCGHQQTDALAMWALANAITAVLYDNAIRACVRNYRISVKKNCPCPKDYRE